MLQTQVIEENYSKWITMNQGFPFFLFLSDLGKGKRKIFRPFFFACIIFCARGGHLYNQEDSAVEISPNGIPNFLQMYSWSKFSIFFSNAFALHVPFSNAFSGSERLNMRILPCFPSLLSEMEEENSLKIWISRRTFSETKAICRPWRRIWRTAWKQNFEGKTI